MTYSYEFSPDLDKDLIKIKKKDPVLHEKIMKKVLQIIEKPELYKPLKYVKERTRRVHINPFVLTFEIEENAVKFLAIEHHDKAYRK